MPHLLGHGAHKYPKAGVLGSSRDRRWKGIDAELRSHCAGELPPTASTQFEIAMAIEGNDGAVVERRNSGTIQSSKARSDTIWFCPAGLQDNRIRITESVPKVVHLYFQPVCFEQLSLLTSRPAAATDVPYLADVDDDFVRQMCLRIADELENESVAGTLLVEHLSSCLAAHILSKYHGHRIHAECDGHPSGLDRHRLRRVIEYIDDRLDTELTVSELAAVACLSRFHFARSFKLALGQSPYSFIASRRLDRAKQLLSSTDLPVADVSFLCGFSCQASFSRAFRQGSGTTPGAFRTQSRS